MPYEVDKLNARFLETETREILEWCLQELAPDLALTSSFQVSGVVLLDILHRLNPDIPVYFIDTGYHFPETLEFKDKICKDFRLSLRTIRPDISRSEAESKYGRQLYKKDPDLCCRINKVLPIKTAKERSGVSHWISALRRDQSASRADHKVFMRDESGHLRIHPLINWTWKYVWKYTLKHELPYHPLYDQGYTSIGCFPPQCTSKNDFENGERAGRWKSSDKRECGIHLGLHEGKTAPKKQKGELHEKK